MTPRRSFGLLAFCIGVCVFVATSSIETGRIGVFGAMFILGGVLFMVDD